MIPMRVESEEPLRNPLEEKSAHGFGKAASLQWPSGGQLPRAHERDLSRATQEHANPGSFGALILNFFQRSREPHFPEPYLDL